MSVDITLEFLSDGQAHTEQIGEQIGHSLRGGEVFDLSSDLGGGKTTFVRGLAHGAGSQDQVASPTFTVSKLYDTGKLHIHHFDFYRLHEAGIMAHEVAELIQDPTNVVIVEWSEVVEQVLPARRVSVSLERVKSGEDDRRVIIKAPAKQAYLFENLTGMQ